MLNLRGKVHITQAFTTPSGDIPTNDKHTLCLVRIDSYVTNVPPSGERIRSLKKAIRASTVALK